MGGGILLRLSLAVVDGSMHFQGFVRRWPARAWLEAGYNNGGDGYSLIPKAVGVGP